MAEMANYPTSILPLVLINKTLILLDIITHSAIRLLIPSVEELLH